MPGVTLATGWCKLALTGMTRSILVVSLQNGPQWYLPPGIPANVQFSLCKIELSCVTNRLFQRLHSHSKSWITKDIEASALSIWIAQLSGSQTSHSEDTISSVERFTWWRTKTLTSSTNLTYTHKSLSGSRLSIPSHDDQTPEPEPWARTN